MIGKARINKCGLNSNKITLNILEYLIYICFFTLLSIAKLGEGFLPLSASFLVALFYSKREILLPSLCFIVSGLINGLLIENLVYIIVPVVVFLLLAVILKNIEKEMPLWTMVVILSITLMPSVLLNKGYLINSICSVFINAMAAYLIGNFFYAINTRGLYTKLTSDELAGIGTLLILVSLGLYTVAIFGFRPYYLLLGFLILMLSSCSQNTLLMLVSFTYGFGGALGSNGTQLLGGIIVLTVIVKLFSKGSCLLALSAMIITDLGVGILFNCFENYSYLHIIALFIGGFSFVVIPKKEKEKIISILAPMNVEENIVNKYKKQTGKKLENLSYVFYEMGHSYAENSYTAKSKGETIKELSVLISRACCSDCAEKSRCTYSLGGELSTAMDSISKSAIEKGHASKEDASIFLTSRCVNLARVVAEATELVQNIEDKRVLAKTMDSSQRMLSNQMLGISLALNEMSKDMIEDISFDKIKEERVREEFGYVGIACKDVSCYGRGDEVKVEICLPKNTRDVDMIESVTTKAIGKDMVINDFSEKGERSVYYSLTKKARYQIVYGEAGAKKLGSSASGDSRVCRKLDRNKVLLALCDGMGSGEAARRESTTTLKLLESFYKAGCGDRLALSMINNMLAIKNRENFSALDLAIFDLNKGIVDIIKLGGVESFISRANGIEVVTGCALPLGIVNEAKPYIERKQISNGDMVVMATDGIIDALTVKGVSLIMERVASVNPQEYCDVILEEALRRTKEKEGDDCSVVAARLFVA